MKIRLLRNTAELCVLDGGPIPKGVDPRMAAVKILEYFREGEWVWVDENTRGIRFASITTLEIVPENLPDEYRINES